MQSLKPVPLDSMTLNSVLNVSNNVPFVLVMPVHALMHMVPVGLMCSLSRHSLTRNSRHFRTVLPFFTTPSNGGNMRRV